MKRLILALLMLSAMAQAGSVLIRRSGLSGTNDNDIILLLKTASGDAYSSPVEACFYHQLASTAGAMDVFVSQDTGASPTFQLLAKYLEDLGSATPSTAVAVTAAGVAGYGFTGHFSAIKILQNGATAVVGASYKCE